MQYTKAQLETQLSLVQDDLQAELSRVTAIQQKDYLPAKNYGEKIRDNHLKMAYNRIKHYETRIANLTEAIRNL